MDRPPQTAGVETLGSRVPVPAPHSARSAPVGIRGLGAALVTVAIVAAVILLWPQEAGSGASPSGATIVMHDYSFAPNRLTWRAGDTVTVTLVNRSSSRPGAPHEIMFGRRPLRETGPLGVVQGDGFEEQFLDGATVELLNGNGVSMIMAEKARLTGADPMTLMAPDMSMSGVAMRRGMDFMAVLEPLGTLSVRFRVPDRPGQWEFGCFAQDGQHYLNGMRGALTVVGL